MRDCTVTVEISQDRALLVSGVDGHEMAGYLVVTLGGRDYMVCIEVSGDTGLFKLVQLYLVNGLK